MAYDEHLASRIRKAPGKTPGVTEKKMFGGLAFLLDGKMFIGINNEDLMVRVGADGYDAALAQKHVRPMDFTGRPLEGFVYVATEGLRTSAALAKWVGRSVTYVEGLPPKKAAPKRPRPRPRSGAKPRLR